MSNIDDHGTSVNGCISCLVRLPCFGRFKHPNGSRLIQHWAQCSAEGGGAVKEITQPKLWRNVFGLIGKATPWKNNEEIAPEFLDDVKRKIVETPRGRNFSQKLLKITNPVIQKWKNNLLQLE